MGNDILFYIIGAEALVIVGLYFWRSFTAKRLEAANNALAAIEAVGLDQKQDAEKENKRSERIKAHIDGKLKKNLAAIDIKHADRMRNSSSGDVSDPSGVRTGGIKEADVRRHPVYITLGHRYDRLYAEMMAIKEWYNREKGG
jgi:hypothetical protein